MFLDLQHLKDNEIPWQSMTFIIKTNVGQSKGKKALAEGMEGGIT